MLSRNLVTGFLLVLLVVSAGAEVRELQVDPLSSLTNWQLGGHRVNYVLGASSLGPSTEQTRDGAPSLKLVYDLADGQRSYLSAYHTGPYIPGECAQVHFWLYGNASGCRLRLALEDARERWFERDMGVIDWEGWREITATVGEGADWRALLRHGEEELSILHPVNLRQIAVHRGAPDQENGAVYLSDLRAVTDVVPIDYVDAQIATGKPANLLVRGGPADISISMANRGDQAASGLLAATVTDFFGMPTRTELGSVNLGPGEAIEKTLRYPSEKLGTLDLAVTLTGAGRERVWYSRFAVTEPVPPRPADPDALFGCMFNLSSFSAEQLPTVLDMNRDAGMRWARIGFGWGEINPTPGSWAWDGPKRVDGPVGKAIDARGQAFRVPHSPKLDCPDEVTIAFWARGTEQDGSWQCPMQKWGPGNRRNYGVYFHRDNGQFHFSASYEKLPEAGWRDLSSGFCAWDNKWHHYAATYSAEDKRVCLYVDGELTATHQHDGGKLRINQDDLVIGSSCPAPLDEMVLYNRALSADEVKTLAAKATPPGEGLIAWWPFDDEGTDLADASGNGFDLAGSEPSGARYARIGLENGIKTLGLLGFPPNWASTAPEGAARPWVHKPDLEAWAQFVENTTRHYKDIVQHWEIWNEPNITVFWEPEPDPREFIDVVKVGYEAAKRGNPDCTVIMPGLAGPGQNRWGMDFLDGLLELGASNYCDAISIHPYRQSTPEQSDLVGDLRHIADMSEKYGQRRKIWFTENCWTTQLPGGSTEHRAALMLPRCYALSLGSGEMDRFIWFRFHDPGVDRFYGEHNYGMCYNDLTPKPAYFAHRTTSLLLDGTEPAGEWDLGPRAMARVFRRGDERVAAVWCPEGDEQACIYTGEDTVRSVDIMGNEETLPTTDGVLMLRATEATTFLCDLPEAAEGRGTVLSVKIDPLPRGAAATLPLVIRNPFNEQQTARVSLSVEAPLAIGQTAIEAVVPANSRTELPVPVTVAGDAEPGRHEIAATVDLGGLQLAQRLPVTVRGAAADAGPVGYWKLDEGQGATIGDSSEHGNDGTVANPRWVDGKHGKALEFNGTDIAVVPDAPSLNLRDEVTVAFWFKLLKATANWQFPVAKYFQENIRRNYGIYIHKDQLSPCFSASFEKGTYLHNDTAADFKLEEGQWHHLAATYSMFEGSVCLYVDGELEVRQPVNMGALKLTTDPLRIGSTTNGVVDEVMVYPRALSAEQIRELAQ